MLFFLVGSLLLASFLVISSRNPVHSVLSLISVFLLSSVLLLYLEVEFLALSFVIIYVGAIAILFLFIVMMLDIKFNDSSSLSFFYAPLVYLFSFIFFLEVTLPLVDTIYSISLDIPVTNYYYTNWFNEIDYFSNIKLLGQVLYTYYFLYFLIAGFILFVAVIGALMLTLNLSTKSVKKQHISRQLSRHSNNAFMVYKK